MNAIPAAAPRPSGAKRDCPVGSCLRSSFCCYGVFRSVYSRPATFRQHSAGHKEHPLDARLRGRLNSAPDIPLRQQFLCRESQIVIVRGHTRAALSGACSAFVLFACPSAFKLLDQSCRRLPRHHKAGPRRSGENTYIGAGRSDPSHPNSRDRRRTGDGRS